MGPKGEMVHTSVIPKYLEDFYIRFRADSWLLICCLHGGADDTNPVLLQGPRGLDGDPGPQGVAGAIVSLSQSFYLQ